MRGASVSPPGMCARCGSSAPVIVERGYVACAACGPAERRCAEARALEERWRLRLALLLVAWLGSGCAPYPDMVSARFGGPSPSPAPAPPPAPAPAPVYFPGGPPPPAAVIEVRGMLVYPPAWFPAGDEAALARAVEEYLDDAEGELVWRLPRVQFGRPLVLVLHDDQARPPLEYRGADRFAWLQWPAGPSGLPVAAAILPGLEEVLALEHQIDRGGAMRGPSPEEAALALRGRTLPVAMATRYPWLYQR